MSTIQEIATDIKKVIDLADEQMKSPSQGRIFREAAKAIAQLPGPALPFINRILLSKAVET
jgi:hypothetical protein